MHAVVDQLPKLKLAVAASWFAHGDARLARRVRTVGLDAFNEVLDSLCETDLDRVIAEAEALHARGVSAVLMGTDEYPIGLAQIRGAPPYMFFLGPPELLASPGIGMCGSRDASSEGLRAAAACGEVATQHGLTAVSGYARGVDMTTHISSLASGGTTVIVLPEGINRFRVKQGPFTQVWDPKRTLVLSQFSPNRPWSTGGAMMRNTVIIGLSRALVVVEANDKGGTLAAGKKALDLNRQVIALEFSQVPRGNAVLIKRGAVPARNRSELSERLRIVANGHNESQLTIL